jgi:hypothetical protein
MKYNLKWVTWNCAENKLWTVATRKFSAMCLPCLIYASTFWSRCSGKVTELCQQIGHFRPISHSVVLSRRTLLWIGGPYCSHFHTQYGTSKVLRNIGILPHHYTASQLEDAGNEALRNDGILPHHFTCHNLKMERARSSKTLASYHITTRVTTSRWKQRGPPKRWYPTTSLHMSQPADGSSTVLRNVGILPHHYTVSQPEDGGSMVLRNVGILPHHYTVSQPEDGGSMVLRNFGILPRHYMASQPGRPRHEIPPLWKSQMFHTLKQVSETKWEGRMQIMKSFC